MSMQCFLAVDKPLHKFEYRYKDILPTISETDMFYNDKISFSDKLNETEQETLGNLFQDFIVYAINTGFHLNYEPRYKQVLSERTAICALEELKWFKSFAKKRLLKTDVFMVVNLWLGKENNLNKIKHKCIDINNWELSDDKSFEFEYGKVYQFIDNSEEAILNRKSRQLISF